MKKAEKAAASSRAKSEKDKGTKSKTAAPARTAKAKAGKAEAGTKASKAGGKKPSRAEAKAEAKIDAKIDAKGDGKNKRGAAKGRGKPGAAAEAGAVTAVEAAREAEADLQVVQPLLPLVDKAPPPPPELSEEERELASLYQGDLEAPSLAHGEFKDQKTADEDRPMLPEINARDERRRSWEDRRERRRQEREQRRLARRDGHRGQQDRGGNGGGGHRPPQQDRRDGGPPGHAMRPDRGDRGERGQQDRGGQQDRPLQGSAPVPQAPPAAVAGAGAASPAGPVEAVAFGTPMAAATATLYAQLRNGQPLPVKQLAAMLRKRGLIEGEPELVWPQLRAELLADERAYRALGLRPRVVHRGRDLFAPGPAATEPEAQLVGSVAAIQAATARSLSAWMTSASPAAFERLIHAYLVAVGYRDITWVKRVDGIAYAQATAPGIERSVLVSARAGNAPIDRRGIGELRVGVEAKGLPFGYLFSATALSADAERELERAGRSIAVVCGDALVAALMAAGIGVATTAVTVRFVDEQFLEDLTVG